MALHLIATLLVISDLRLLAFRYLLYMWKELQKSPRLNLNKS
jgi:hypothetical protein